MRTVLILSALIAIAFASQGEMVQQTTQNMWILDLIVGTFDIFCVMIITPFLYLGSFFANNQVIYVQTIRNLMVTKGLSFSGYTNQI